MYVQPADQEPEELWLFLLVDVKLGFMKMEVLLIVFSVNFNVLLAKLQLIIV